MHVKRFHRPTVREALAAARETLGPGALVLSTEMVAAPGWRGWIGARTVALTAALDRPDTPVAGSSIDGAPERLADRKVSADRRPVVAARQAPLAAQRKGIVARLAAAGVPAGLAAAAADRITPADCRGGSAGAVRRALSAECASFIARDRRAARVEVFVGPPGVGKTTTIAKIVAQERAAGRDPRGMVAADAFRVGAIEHLRGYASVIGAPFRVARDGSELEAALAASIGSVLVDTAGRSPSDDGFRSLLDVLRRRTDVRTHLVVAADTSIEAANRLFDRYASARPDCVVITKLDEAHSASRLLGVIRDRQLPVSYLAAGQRVPEDLAIASEHAIASALLGEMADEGVACH